MVLFTSIGLGNFNETTFMFLFIFISFSQVKAQMLITGVVDGPLTGGTPKAVEFYAQVDIPDLSIYGFGSANNGGGSDGEEFTFPAVVLQQVNSYMLHWNPLSL